MHIDYSKATSSNIASFTVFMGDEDPDLLYDEENDRWLMAICRLDLEIKQYIYVFLNQKILSMVILILEKD